MQLQISAPIDGRILPADATPEEGQAGTNLMFALIACGIATVVIGTIVATVLIRKKKSNGSGTVNTGNISNN